MSDTPRTDKELIVGHVYASASDPHVPADLARTLERELAKASRERDTPDKPQPDCDLIRRINELEQACHAWQRGHVAIVRERDLWRDEATRWRAIADANNRLHPN